jgi:hypothetical protein
VGKAGEEGNDSSSETRGEGEGKCKSVAWFDLPLVRGTNAGAPQQAEVVMRCSQSQRKHLLGS